MPVTRVLRRIAHAEVQTGTKYSELSVDLVGPLKETACTETVIVERFDLPVGYTIVLVLSSLPVS